MTSTQSALTGAAFEGLPEAPTPPAPDEPGGSLGLYEPERWKPERIRRFILKSEFEDETFFGYVTLQFAAELFNVQKDRLQMAILRGTLPGKKVEYSHLPGKGGQGQWFVHPGHVAHYLSTTFRGVTGGVPAFGRRKKTDEMGPARARIECQRLRKMAALADTRAQELRDRIAQLENPNDPAQLGDLRLRLNRQVNYAKNRRRMAEALELQAREFAEAPAQAAASAAAAE